MLRLSCQNGSGCWALPQLLYFALGAVASGTCYPDGKSWAQRLTLRRLEDKADASDPAAPAARVPADGTVTGFIGSERQHWPMEDAYLR